MVTIDIDAVGEEFESGEVEITITVESDLEDPTLEDSSVLINGVEQDYSVEAIEGGWEFSLSVVMLGGQSPTIVVTADDGEGSVTASGVFYITEDSSFNLTQNFTNPYLDRLADYFPEYSSARHSSESILRQLLNPVAEKLDDLRLSLSNHNRSLDINKVLESDPDWLYELYLGREFERTIKPDGDYKYIAPEVHAQLGVNYFECSVLDGFRELWYKLPDLYIAEEVALSPIQVSPSASLDSLVDIPSRSFISPTELYIWIAAASKLIEVSDNPITASIIINGASEGNAPQTEKIDILTNGTIKSKRIWSSIEEVALASKPSSGYAEIVLYTQPPRMDTKEDELYATLGNPWQWSIETEGASFLNKGISQRGYLGDIANGSSTVEIMDRRMLLDAEGEAFIVDDFCIDPASTLLYAISGSVLCVYDRRDTRTRLFKFLGGQTEDPEVSFHVTESGNKTFAEGEQVSRLRVEAGIPRRQKTIREWYWQIEKENGDISYLDLDGEETNVRVVRRNSFPVLKFGIDEGFDVVSAYQGAMIISLVMTTTEGEVQVVKRLVDLSGKKPIAQYKILALDLLEDEETNISINRHSNLFVRRVDKSFLLSPVFLSCIPDFEESRLMFKTRFDRVDVKFNA